MLNAIIKFCLEQRLLIVILSALLGLLSYRALVNNPKDAIPDISENQTIVSTEWMGHSPEDVEDQITYPLSVVMQGIPKVRDVRTISGFGFSRIYVVFEDEVDIYWARSRVVERLSVAAKQLPEGVTPTLGPDATSLGQIFWYTLEGPQDLAAKRTIQDYIVRYALQEVEGVAEVASVGGFVKEYQIDVDPERLRAHNVSVQQIVKAIKESNLDVGAKTIEQGGMEFLIRGLGLVEHVDDLEKVVIKNNGHIPVTLSDIARVQLGPAFRRGALADHSEEKVGGVITMRYGANPLEVIEGVKQVINDLGPALPENLSIQPFYDRTELIEETLETLTLTLTQELIITALVVAFFLLHIRSALIICLTLPLAVLFAFLLMETVGIGSNIMSLAGIAIAIGTVVDMGIVMTETIHRHLQEDGGKRRRVDVILEAATEVGGAIITAVSITILTFIPVFYLSGQSYKLFAPLAWTKTFMLSASVLIAITLVPALCYILLGKSQRMRSIENNFVGRAIVASYVPTLRYFLRRKSRLLALCSFIMLWGGIALLGARTVLFPVFWSADSLGIDSKRFPPLASLERWFPGFGTEFMPPLDEGSFLYMPSLLQPGSLSETLRVMQWQNKQMMTVPEVALVVGKLGRADTALDPAPIGMIETVVNLKPKEEWREGMTPKKIEQELRRATDIPGVAPSWLQPIETRIVMLSSGIKARIGLELVGDDSETLEQLAREIEPIIKSVPGATDVAALRTGGKPYIKFHIRRDRLQHYGLSTQQVQSVIEVAIGGKAITYATEGRERYPVRVRYERELRDTPSELDSVLVSTPSGAQVPLSDHADMEYMTGPASIRGINGKLVGYVMFNPVDTDETRLIASVEDRLNQAIATKELEWPAGYGFRWVGQYKEAQKARKRLSVILPVIAGLILLLLYLHFKRVSTTLFVFLGLPLGIAGGILMIQYYPWICSLISGAEQAPPIYMTLAVIIGFIALGGIVIDDGVIICTYIQQLCDRRKPNTVDGLRAVVVEAGSRRIRPALMTTITTILALLPILWSSGRGADVMQPMALPVFGGMLIELLTLFVCPTAMCYWLERECKGAGK